MTISLLLALIPMMVGAYRLARHVGARHPAMAFALFWVGLACTLGLLVVRQFPLHEQHLLRWPEYIYARDFIHLPFVSLLMGLAWGRLDDRSWKSLRLFFVVIAILALYNMRWAAYAFKYAPLDQDRDGFGIVGMSYRDTGGAACCATIAGYYGLGATEGDAAVLSLTRPYEGASAAGMVHALRLILSQSGCEVDVAAPDWADLADEKGMGICLMARNVYGTDAVVFYGANEQHVLIGDPRPGGGLIMMPRDQFLSCWTGIMIRVRAPFYVRPSLLTPPTWM